MSKNPLIGREVELASLDKMANDKQSHFTVMYGRRRIGKSELLKHFCKNKRAFYYHALETSKKNQIRSFLKDCAIFVKEPLIATAAALSWKEAFDVIFSKLPKEKIVFVLDEFPWMCGTDRSLMSVLQYFWDHHWQHNNKIHLVLCGSSTSFMISEVLSEKSPLFGRRTKVMELKELPPCESQKIMETKSIRDAARYLMCFGGIPAYLKLYNPHQSFEQNLNQMAFVKEGYFLHELDFILSSQLKQPIIYHKILHHLAFRSLSLADLSKVTKHSTGSLIYNLDRLKEIRIIKDHHPISKSDSSKTVLYKISDDYVRFYFLFIKPFLEKIEKNRNRFIWSDIVSEKWNSFLGGSFERFCHKNLDLILKKLSVEEVFSRSGIYWHQKSVRNGAGVQIDLVIEREDNVTMIGECKWSDGVIGYEILKELETKCERYPNPKKHKLRKLLITTGKLSTNLVDHPDLDIVLLEDFFKSPHKPYTKPKGTGRQ